MNSILRIDESTYSTFKLRYSFCNVVVGKPASGLGGTLFGHGRPRSSHTAFDFYIRGVRSPRTGKLPLSLQRVSHFGGEGGQS